MNTAASHSDALKNVAVNASLAESIMTSSIASDHSSGIGSILNGMEGIADMDDFSDSNYAEINADIFADSKEDRFHSMNNNNRERTDSDSVPLQSRNNINESIQQIERNIEMLRMQDEYEDFDPWSQFDMYCIA